MDSETDHIALAAEFINSTRSHVFLTGKAGTGKTTFLKQLADSTHKKYIIVAPTGIAALNAGGVTIHSQFLFPTGTYLPEPYTGSQPEGMFFTQNMLARRHPLNSIRRKVLRNIELLVIDEVSMLRSDLLDAIDYRMKAVKRNFSQSFGGVQLLLVGDLYQLPPVVRNNEQHLMQPFYKSPFFFDARALAQDGFTYIELQKIFRQHDDKFIGILNHLRDGKCTEADVAELNKQCRSEIPASTSDEPLITLTTHNFQADNLNQKELKDLPGKSFEYEAKVEGDYPESLFPLPLKLTLKVGAQVMFIKNDTQDQRFFNGKLAQVVSLKKDGITVRMAGETENYQLQMLTWTNKKYQLNQQNELEEDVVGSYTQFPIKLAWAITVHKSQGLTFDKAIIDVQQAFAPGQVYVALSRLRSLEGLILRNPIKPSVISSDANVVAFSTSRNDPDGLRENLKNHQKIYLQELLQASFDFKEITDQLTHTLSGAATKMQFEDPDMQQALDKLYAKFISEQENTRKFQAQIGQLLRANSQEILNERVDKGKAYYLKFLTGCLKDLLQHLEEVKLFSRTKAYQNELTELDQLLTSKINAIQKSSYIATCIFSGKEITAKEEWAAERLEIRQQLLKEIAEHLSKNPKVASTKSGRKRKKSTGKASKGETYEITYSLFKQGKSATEIAAERGMALSTIEGHLARGIGDSVVDINSLLGPNEISLMQEMFDSTGPAASLKEVYTACKGEFSFGKLKMMQAYLEQKKAKANEHG